MVPTSSSCHSLSAVVCFLSFCDLVQLIFQCYQLPLYAQWLHALLQHASQQNILPALQISVQRSFIHMYFSSWMCMPICGSKYFPSLFYYFFFMAFSFVLLHSFFMFVACNLSSYMERAYLLVEVCVFKDKFLLGYMNVCATVCFGSCLSHSSPSSSFFFACCLLHCTTEMFSMTLKCMKLIFLHGNCCGTFRSSFWSSCWQMCSLRSDKCCANVAKKACKWTWNSLAKKILRSVNRISLICFGVEVTKKCEENQLPICRDEGNFARWKIASGSLWSEGRQRSTSLSLCPLFFVAQKSGRCRTTMGRLSREMFYARSTALSKLYKLFNDTEIAKRIKIQRFCWPSHAARMDNDVAVKRSFDSP